MRTTVSNVSDIESTPPGEIRDRQATDAPVVIEQSPPWKSLRLAELWSFRELLYFLIWRDLKVRYKQTALGAAWVVMQPLLMTVVFAIFLGKFARVPSPRVPYAVLVCTGLLPWTFFSASLTTTGNSLVGNAHLITKVYFPRMIIPLAAVAGRLVDFLISFVVFFGLVWYYRVAITWQMTLLPVFVLLLSCLAVAVGMLTSALNVKYRDVGLVLPLLTQIWMFVSPIIYPIEIVPEQWRALYSINPLVGIINGFRACLLGTGFDRRAIAISIVITTGLLIASAYLFSRMEKSFADVI